MSVLYWIGGTGSQPWTTGANWSGGSAPVSSDDVHILNGSSNIDSGLAQSAVTLASLTIGSGFTGTIGTAGEAGTYLAIGITTIRCISAGSTSGFLSGGFTMFKWNPAAVDYTLVCSATGSPSDSGRGALQIKGGTSSSKAYVTAGSVDFAAKPGETGTLTTLDVSGGTVVLGSGMTCPTITQVGTGSIVTTNGAVTTLTQQSGTLNTFGTALLTTVKVNGTCNFNHRPTGNAFTNLTLDSDAVANFAADPRTVLFANAPTFYEGATIRAFNRSQLKLAGPANFSFLLEECAFEDVTLDLGSDITVTVA